MTEPTSLLGSILDHYGITPTGAPHTDLGNLAHAMGINDTGENDIHNLDTPRQDVCADAENHGPGAGEQGTTDPFDPAFPLVRDRSANDMRTASPERVQVRRRPRPSRYLQAYRRALDTLRSADPAAAAAIERYVQELRAESAGHRVAARDAHTKEVHHG